MLRFALSVGLVAACHAAVPASAGAAGRSLTTGPAMITQNTSDAITAGQSVACPPDGPHDDNSYWRRFDLDGDHAITSCFQVSRVDFGVELASAPDGSQPVWVRLHTIPNAAPLTTANLTSIGSFPLSVTNQSLTIIQTPGNAIVIDPLLLDLVVEVYTPSGQDAGDLFLIGSNGLGQSAPSYLSAPDCGIAQPTDLADQGYPNMHIYMSVVGGGCSTAAPTASWGRIKTLYR